MKLAEALLIRADQKKKILSLRERIVKNTLVQEGSKPSEDVAQLIQECFRVQDEQSALVLRINAANAAGTLADGRSLPAVLAERDVLRQRHAVLTQAVNATHKEERDHYSPREIKWLPQIDVPAIQKQMEDLAAKIRALNVHIQQANWNIEVPE